MRTVIIGNSGSGKTWLAKRLSDKEGVAVMHLDEVFWLPGGFNEKRDPTEVSRLIDSKKNETMWIVEGVYGNLANQFLPSALTLVWLDMPWPICKQRLELRGSESKAHLNREQSEQGLHELVHWAEAYRSRLGSSSYVAHLEMFEAFSGCRFRLQNEAQIYDYLNSADNNGMPRQSHCRGLANAD